MAEQYQPDGARVFLASRNRKKLAEMQRILGRHLPGVQVLGLDDVAPYDEPAETEPPAPKRARKRKAAAEADPASPTDADTEPGEPATTP